MNFFCSQFYEQLKSWWKTVEETPSGLYFLLGLGIAWKTALLIFIYQKAPTSDGVKYIRAAQELLAGNMQQSLSIYPMPAFPALLAGASLVFRDWILSGKVLSCFFIILAQIPLYKITYRWFGSRAAFWATFAFCLEPFSNEMSTLILRGPPFIFFLGLSILLIIKALESPTLSNFIKALCATIFPPLFRVEGIILPPFFILAWMFFALCLKKHTGKSLIPCVACTLILLFGIIFIFSPQIQEYGSFYRFCFIRERIKTLISLDFLENYRYIYNQIESLEALSPYPSQNQNFAEIGRHLLWLIYLLGLLQTVAETLFPLFLLPLAIGLKKSSRARPPSQVFLLTFLFLYFLILYIDLINMDFTDKRFTWGIAFLLYPWVGKGMQMILTFLTKERKKVFIKFIISFFIFFPLTGIPKIFDQPDRISLEAGEWVAETGCNKIKILGNDLRIALAAGLSFYYDDNNRDNSYIDFRTKSRDFSSADYSRMEQIALERSCNFIILKIRNKKFNSTPSFRHYSLVKTFKNRRKTVYAFVSYDTLKQCFQGKDHYQMTDSKKK